MVCLVTITGQITMEFISQKFQRMVSAPGSLILEKDHSWGAAVLIRKVYPHPVLGGAFLSGFINDLNPGFITMDVPALEKYFLHQVINRLQIPFCTQDNPVCHCLCGQVQVISCKFPFLTGERHPIHIFSIHNACNKRRCRNTSL